MFDIAETVGRYKVTVVYSNVNDTQISMEND